MRQTPTSRRARRVLLLACVAACAGAWGASARAVTLLPHPVTEVHLVKAQHEGLRFHWQAVVSENGGAFVLRRRGAHAGVDVLQFASPRQRAYDAWWRAPAESGVYELRYRAASGDENVLAVMLVNCHTLRDGEPGVDTARARPPVNLPAMPAIVTTPLDWCVADRDVAASTLPREPLLPPPRPAARA